MIHFIDAIRDGIKAGLPYKQIRALAKDRVAGLMPLLGGIARDMS